jgi:hypothetical protein
MQNKQKPKDALVAEMVKELDANLREDFEERAAIIEFDAKLPRAHAECLALLDVIRRHPLSVKGITVLQIELDEETQWLVATDLDFARRHLADIGGIEKDVLNLSDVIHEQYGGVALLTTLG